MNPETKEPESIWDVAEREKINVNLCTPLFQGRLVNVPFQTAKLNHFSTNAAKHLELVRSLQKNALLSTIFGTINPQHLK